MEEKFLQEEGPAAGRNSQFLTKNASNKAAYSGSFAAFDPALLKGNLFCAAEKLKSKKTIDKLFNEGKSVSQNGFTLVYLPGALLTGYPAQAGFSVPKRFFKHAVDRNRIKRLMREAYRLNKKPFYQKLAGQKQQMAVMFVFKGKTLPTQPATTQAIQACLNRVKI